MAAASESAPRHDPQHEAGPRFTWQTELPQWALIALMFLAAAVAWSAAPDRIPVHWNAQGQPDGYGGRAEGLLLLPATALGLYVLFLVLPWIDPFRVNYASFSGAYTVMRMAVLALMVVLYGAIHLMLRGYAVDFTQIVPVAIGALFVVLGSVFGRIRRNWFVGIRTPWTLTSEVSWTRTHRLGAWLFPLLGVLLALAGVVRTGWWLWVVVVGSLLVTGTLFVYSYLIWRTDPNRARWTRRVRPAAS